MRLVALQRKIDFMSDFLLEIGLEEIPARMIAGAEAELGKRVQELLTRERLLDDGANVMHQRVKTYSTPRRLAVLVEGVRAAQADVEEKLTGPSSSVAFKDGSATKAAEAFAKKAGVDVAALEKVTTAKGEYVGATVKRAGKAAPEILGAELPKEALGIYWAKNMYWNIPTGQKSSGGGPTRSGKSELGCGDAGWCFGAGGDCWDCGGEGEPRAPHSAWGCAGCD
jgi:glycyl-tRNA synthetase beta subunit